MVRVFLKMLLRPPGRDAVTEAARRLLIAGVSAIEVYRTHRDMFIAMVHFYKRKGYLTGTHLAWLKRINPG